MQIRLRKDGGYSECNSPDELVGKGRCIHVLEPVEEGSSENKMPLEINRTSRGVYQVEIPNDIVNEAKSKEDIFSYMKELPKISKAKEKRIIASLANM